MLALLGLVVLGGVAYVLGRRVARSRLGDRDRAPEVDDVRAIARDLGLPS